MAQLGRSFLTNVSILTVGTVLSQGILAASLLFTTRLYSPEEFSFLAIYAAILGPLIAVAGLRYNVAIPLPRSDLMGVHLLVAAVFSALLFCAALTIPMIFFSDFSVALIGQPDMKAYLWMIPVGVFIASLYSSLQYWASRKKLFIKVTQTRITRAIGGASTQIGFGAFGHGPFGLLFGHMLYGGLGVFGLGRELWRHERGHISKELATNTLSTAKRYKRFPFYSVPEALFDSAGSQIPIILIAAATIGPEAGMLFLAMRFLAIPVSLVGSSVAQVFLSEAPAKHAAGELHGFTTAIILKLFMYGAGPIVGIGLLAPSVFPIIFGPEWARAGIITLWLTPWFLCQFVVSPVSVVLHVTNRISTAMWLHLFGFILRVGAVLFATIIMPDYLVEVYALSGAVFGLSFLAVVLFFLKLDQRSNAR